MQFKIFGRSVIERGWEPSEPAILISITDRYRELDHPKYSDKFHAVLQLKFDDIDNIELLKQNMFLFSESDAHRILTFVKRWQNEVDLIVCNCEAGLSRSAGTAAALSNILNGDDTRIFRIRPYLNRYIYRMILETYHNINFNWDSYATL